jgi:exopolysaccharide biosynthesis protein
MNKKTNLKSSLVIFLLFITFLSSTITTVYAETIMARFVSVYDSQTGKATTVLAGYCKSDPVVIGPSIKEISEKRFTSCTKDNLDDIFFEKDITLKRVTKFANSDKEIVAEVVIDRCN